MYAGWIRGHPGHEDFTNPAKANAYDYKMQDKIQVCSCTNLALRI